MIGKRIRFFGAIVMVMVVALGGELFYGYRYLVPDGEAMTVKKSAVRLIGLPDLAVATEARFLRFRSLSDVFSPFNEGPELLDYFPAAFTYAPPSISNIPSRIAQP